MNIVVLDGFTANPGDLSWDGLKELGELTVYERTKPEELLERAKGAEMLLTNKVVIDADAMAALPDLRYIGVLATGYNVVDIEEAHRRSIAVTNIPAYSTMSVAQMVMAHLLNITNQVALHAESVRSGAWERSLDFSFSKAPLIELDGLTFGIVGLGNIGKQVAKMAQALGMQVMAVSSKSEEELRLLNIRKATGYEQLFSEADVVSLHCPLTDETHHLVNRERLSLMKHTAILINTGRGPLLDEQAVAEALAEGRLYAAGIDVLTEEPPRHGSPLLRLKGNRPLVAERLGSASDGGPTGGSAPNCYITPHIAWASKAARRRLIDIATANVAGFLQGKELNRIDR